MKKGILAIVLLLIIVFGFLVGRYIYKISTLENNSNVKIAENKKIEDECTLEYERLEEIKQASANEEKISPNAKIITNIYYNECGHTVKTISDIENKYINLNKEEFQEEYKDWDIRGFSPEEVTIYKEEEGICNEHYMVRDIDGYVTVYSLDKNENETLKETTEISTTFLTTTDLARLKGGIRLYGKENLNSLLEDLE